MKILIFGATGNTGLPLLKQCHSAGVATRALIHDANKRSLVSDYSDDIKQIEFADLDSLRDVFQDCTHMYLVKPFPDNQIVQDAIPLVIERAKKVGLSHITYMSQPVDRMPPDNAACIWHKATEKLIRDSGIAYSFLRPHYFMSNFFGMNLSEDKSTLEIAMPFGNGKRSPTDPADIAAVVLACMQNEKYHNSALELTGPELLSFAEIANVFSENGVPVKYIDITMEQAREKFLAKGVGEKSVESLLELFKCVREHRFEVSANVIENILERPASSLANFVCENKEKLDLLFL